MVPKVITATIVGLDAALIEVEVDVINGLPATIIVGLPNATVQESRERIRCAIRNSGLAYPLTRVAVNLAPADVPKAGTHFDLPIALAILLAGRSARFDPTGRLFAGELSLDGQLRPVPGILAMALGAQAAGLTEVFVPKANQQEAALVEGLKVYGIAHLADLLAHLSGRAELEPAVPERADHSHDPKPEIDFQDIAGHESVKRALEIAVCGGHNILLSGTAGSGKTLLAKAAAGILPPLSRQETLELNKIYSVAGKLAGKFITHRPLRQPHHTASSRALVGGGPAPVPGEVTLAHRGVLFLDEILEFSGQRFGVPAPAAGGRSNHHIPA